MKETELVEQIEKTKPDVVLFGEYHEANSSFRQLVFRLLPKLQKIGFKTLALELRVDHEPYLNKYCNKKIDFASLAAKFEQVSGSNTNIGSIDEQFAEAARLWHNTGGKIIYINSKDPTVKNATNSEGRDHFMYTRLCSSLVDGAGVALVGRNHTFIRSAEKLRQDATSVYTSASYKNWLKGNSTLSTEVQQKFCEDRAFLNVAEMLHKSKPVLTIGEVKQSEDITTRSNWPTGLIESKSISDQSLSLIRVGGGLPSDKAHSEPSLCAPELVHQMISPNLHNWDYLFIRPSDAVDTEVDLD